MTITITSSSVGFTLTASNTMASVATNVTVSTPEADAGVEITGHSDTVTNAGTIIGGDAFYINQGANDVVINDASGYIGVIPVVASGSTFNFVGAANGTVINSGRIEAFGVNNAIALGDGGAITNNSGGTITSGGVFIGGAFGTVQNQGLIVGGGGASYGAVDLSGGGSVTNLSGGTIISTGDFYGVDISGAAGTVTNAGVINGGSGPAITMSPSTYSDLLVEDTTGTIVGGVTLGGTKSTIQLASGTGTISGIGTTFTNFGTLDFAAGAQWAASGSAAGFSSATIDGLDQNDTIDITGFTATSQGTLGAGITFTIAGSGSTNALKLAFGTAVSDLVVTTGAFGTDITTLCFCPGTRIATLNGDVAVEDLAVGDVVRTRGNGGTRRIIWIGQGKVLATRGRRSAATPVIVRKGALGSDVPYRDLHVTKAHGLYLDGVLIPAEFLVNHKTILWNDEAQEVVLYHIELDAHDVVFANGAPAESYRDDGNRWLFQNANSGWDLPPQQPCAPVLTGGPIVDAAWRRLLEQAGPRDLPPLTSNPDLHLAVGGERIDAAEQFGPVRVFWLDACPRGVHIVSRDGVPAELGLARDPRSLGVALRGITLRRGTKFLTIDPGDARLTDGFHGYEAAEDLRWTNGLAKLPAELFDGFGDGGVEIVLTLAGETMYPDLGEAMERAAA